MSSRHVTFSRPGRNVNLTKTYPRQDLLGLFLLSLKFVLISAKQKRVKVTL